MAFESVVPTKRGDHIFEFDVQDVYCCHAEWCVYDVNTHPDTNMHSAQHGPERFWEPCRQTAGQSSSVSSQAAMTHSQAAKQPCWIKDQALHVRI